MPREDERYRNLSPRHPQYCTCVECVEQRKSGQDETVAGKVGGLVGKIAGKAAKAGKVGKGKTAGQVRRVGQIARPNTGGGRTGEEAQRRLRVRDLYAP